MTYRAEKKYADAEPLLITSWNTSRRVLGDEHPDTVRRMANLGLLFLDAGKYGEAKPLLLKASVITQNRPMIIS
jgi:hypothetical protein